MWLVLKTDQVIDWMARLWSCHSNTARSWRSGWRGFTRSLEPYVHRSSSLKFGLFASLREWTLSKPMRRRTKNRFQQMFPILFAMTGWGCGVFCQDLKGVVKGFIFWVSARERVLMDPCVNTFSAQCHSEGLQSSSMCFPNHKWI